MTSKNNLELELNLNLALIIVAFIPFEDVRSCSSRRSDPSHCWNHKIFVARDKSTFRFVMICHNLTSQQNQHNPGSLSADSTRPKMTSSREHFGNMDLKIDKRILKIEIKDSKNRNIDSKNGIKFVYPYLLFE